MLNSFPKLNAGVWRSLSLVVQTEREYLQAPQSHYGNKTDSKDLEENYYIPFFANF